MPETPDYERLAQLTGLPNLTRIFDPERLENLISTAWRLYRRLEPGTPLRYGVALAQYAELAAFRLEHPELLD